MKYGLGVLKTDKHLCILFMVIWGLVMKILVVDDNPIICKGMKTTLEKGGYEVLVA